MTIANKDQAEHWNNSEQAGHWITHQEQYDRMLGPFTDIMLGAAALSPGDFVVDVGCGCGSTTLAAAEAVSPGQAFGVDLSAPMLARARDNAILSRTANAIFEQGDAQDHQFARTFDVVISRFGIMFFCRSSGGLRQLAGSNPVGRTHGLRLLAASHRQSMAHRC